MGRMGPRAAATLSWRHVRFEALSHYMQRVKVCFPDEDRIKDFWAPGESRVDMPIAWPWVGHCGEREPSHTSDTTAMGDLRKERPHSLWSNYETPQGSTGKNLQSPVLP